LAPGLAMLLAARFGLRLVLRLAVLVATRLLMQMAM
jgi:hypothetical protein